jgi:hypothetical protein
MDEYWLALLSEDDVASGRAREFNRTVRQYMDVLVEGAGYRRSPFYDLSVPTDSERFRTMVLRGNGRGVDARLFLGRETPGIVRVHDLGYRLELRPSQDYPGMLIWHDVLDPAVACAEYERRIEKGRLNLEMELEKASGVQEAVDAACARSGWGCSFASAGMALYTSHFVIDRRHDGMFPIGATRAYAPTAWRH